jgi:hypothetical protein
LTDLPPPPKSMPTRQELRDAILNIAAGLTELTEAVDRFALEANYMLGAKTIVRLRAAASSMQDRLKKVAKILVKDDDGQR